MVGPDYLPGYLYVLWILGKINLVLPFLQTITFKLPAIFADIATGYLIYINNWQQKELSFLYSIYLILQFLQTRRFGGRLIA